MVHTEVVLQGDGREGLGRCLHLYVLLRLDGLVESVAPAASLHYTAGLLVHNLDLVVIDHIIDVLLEHCVCLEQLVYGVDALALEGVVAKYLVLATLLLGRSEVLFLQFGNHRAHIRQHEEVRIRHGVGEYVVAEVGHIHGMLFFVDHEVERVGDDVHFLLVVLDIEVLGVLQEHLDARLAEVLYERLVLRQTLVGPEQEQSTFLLIAFSNLLLGIVEYGVDESAL